MHVVGRLRNGVWSGILHNDSGEVKKYVAGSSLKLASRLSWQMSYARLALDVFNRLHRVKY